MGGDTPATPADGQPAGRGCLTPRGGVFALVCAVLCLSLSGCGGCRPDPNAAADGNSETAEQQRQEAFQSQEVQLLPTDADFAAHGIKPGHWLSLRQQLKSNKADFLGDLAAFAGNRDAQAYRLANMPVLVESHRPAILPKGQGKTFELMCFVPQQAASSQQIWIYSNLQTELGGVTRLGSSQIANRMRPYQNFLVVLARRPEAYGYLKTLESIRPPSDEFQIGQVPSDYIAVMPRASAPVPLPSWSMMWTGIAYVLWDDFDPDLLTADQQRAMEEWLHWGGQLIISGPNTLDLLRNSFLGPYLPADAGETESVGAAEVATLDQFWSVASKANSVDPRFPYLAESPPISIALRLRQLAQSVPGTAELVAERRVGRGRVVVTGFSLTARPFTNWRRFDNFFNAVLMRRPPRRFSFTTSGGISMNWIDEVENAIERRRSNLRRNRTALGGARRKRRSEPVCGRRKLHPTTCQRSTAD